jgi:hypothetical protein
MSSSRGKDNGGEQEKEQPGFIKSVIKALSGSRFSTPEGSARNSPTGGNRDEYQLDELRMIGRGPDGVGSRTTPGRESPQAFVERVSEDAFLGPIKESQYGLRYIGKGVE